MAKSNPMHAPKPETIKFFRGSWSGKCKKVIRNQGGNFWGPNRNRCTIIHPEQVEWMIQNGVAERVPGGIKFNP